MSVIAEPESPRMMRGMREDHKELLVYQRNEELARKNLVASQELLQASLIAQGKFDDANKAGIKKGHTSALKKWRDKPDDERCKCEEPNYQVCGTRYWSNQHDTFVTPQMCLNCGHAQAIPELIVPR